ncbi:MAG TPA: hypothetical protein VMW24_15910 [Sedimentisphaerales bacterium]|nr:hypothetical protein [Sedimentisphaerales bacterium]
MLRIDDKVLVATGSHQGLEGYISAMVTGLDGIPSDLMISTYTESRKPIADFFVLPDAVTVIGHWE